MGLYYALSAAAQLVGAITYIGYPATEQWPEPIRFVVSGFATAVVYAGFAFFTLSKTDSLVSKLIPHRDPTPSQLSRRDLLVVAVTLVAVFGIVEAAPQVLLFLGKLIWHLEGTRRGGLWGFIRAEWELYALAAVALLLSLGLVFGADALAGYLQRRSARQK